MYWELFRRKSGHFGFRGKGDNHKTILQSEGYANKADALHTIAVVQEQAAESEIRDLTAEVEEPEEAL